MDQLTRNYIKKILHLPPGTPSGFLYCGKRDGGMGIPKLEILATTTALKQGLTLLHCKDHTLQALFNNNSRLERKLEALAKDARIAWPILNIKTITHAKQGMKRRELKEWSMLPSKGKAVLSFTNDKHENCWLYKPNLLKPSRFLTALRFRSGTTGDRVTPITAPTHSKPLAAGDVATN
jgi:hypothetical protein